MKKHDKSGIREILHVFGTLSRVDCLRVFWNGAFQESSNQDFHSL